MIFLWKYSQQIYNTSNVLFY